MPWNPLKKNWPFTRVFSPSGSVCVDVESVRATTLSCTEQANAEIAARLKRRDADQVEELIELYQHRLLRYLLFLTGNRDLAQDLFQETWLRVLERGGQYNGHARFDTWLFTIARNLMLDNTRRRVMKSLDEPIAADGEQTMDVPSGAPSPFESFQSRENAALVGQALLQLNSIYREVLVLRFHEELSLEEIANVTQAPLSTVKSRLYRGMAALEPWLHPLQQPDAMEVRQ
ncbi:MAG TPA: RNA polymerase sigma factor [Acidobacteriaceae bacterium]|jgi:RNA polymerase sigma-70 factor (ECF subfamily)|nr:RNA polymerase sigma factor [Acidobacteriaceae bacterium]